MCITNTLKTNLILYFLSQTSNAILMSSNIEKNENHTSKRRVIPVIGTAIFLFSAKTSPLPKTTTVVDYYNYTAARVE